MALDRPTRLRGQLLWPLALTIIAIAALAVHGPISQPTAYHDFADQRMLLGVPHFWNVASNLPFLVAGVLGLLALRTRPPGLLPGLGVAYAIVFSGCILLAFGSGYYHLRPDNDSLVWDRLAMAVVFMAFFSAVVGEQVSVRAGRLALTPLIAAGLLSVLWWRITESSGHGDLRLYVVAQFLPLLLLPVMLTQFPARFSRVSYPWAVLLWYVLAKILELLDRPVYELTRGVSGHTLKHVASAAAVLVLIRALQRRTPIRSDDARACPAGSMSSGA